MAEYIEREAAIASIAHEDASFVYAIERIPAADVRPVVLCKDCRWREGCAFDADDDFFCASGKKRKKS